MTLNSICLTMRAGLKTRPYIFVSRDGPVTSFIRNISACRDRPLGLSAWVGLTHVFLIKRLKKATLIAGVAYRATGLSPNQYSIAITIFGY